MVFAYVSAPWDRLKNALVSGFSPARRSGWRSRTSRGLGAFGIAARGVKFVGTAPPAPGVGKPHAAPEYVVDDMYAGVRFPLLWGTTKIGFSLDRFGGIGGMVRTRRG